MKYSRTIYKNFQTDLWESYYINSKGKIVPDRVGLTLADVRDDLKADGYQYEVINRRESRAYQDIDEIINAQKLIDKSLKNWTKLSRADKFSLEEKIKKFGEGYKLDEYNKKKKRLKKLPSDQILKEKLETTINKSYALYTTSKSKFWLSLHDFKHLKNIYSRMKNPSRVNIKIKNFNIDGIIKGTDFDNVQRFQNAISDLIQADGDAEELNNFDIDHKGKLKIQIKGVL